MNKTKYKAVVFDLDGTAVDSQYNIDALQRTCVAMLNREATEQELQITYGMTAKNAIRHLGATEEMIDDFLKLWNDNIAELCKNASLFDGIYETICRLKENGITLGINTSRHSTELGDLRTYVKEPFLDMCPIIVTCDKVANPKPAPDSLIYFMEQGGFSKEEVLFVGDSEFDAGCAKSSGCDFALAVWGCPVPDSIEAEYKPSHPSELLDIVGIG